MTNSVDLYRTMLRIRFAEEKIAENYSKCLMRCPTHLSTGQEHIAANAILNVPPNVPRVVFASHRCHAPYIAAGGSLYKMFAELHGLPSGCCGGRGGSMHLYDPDAGFLGTSAMLGGIVPIALGYAIAKPETTVLCFIGEGAEQEGVFQECAWTIPTIWPPNLKMVIERNGWSTNTRMETIGHNCNRWMEHCGPKRGPDYGKEDPIAALEPSIPEAASIRICVEEEVNEAWERVQRELR